MYRDADHDDPIEWHKHEDGRIAWRSSVLPVDNSNRLAGVALCTRRCVEAGNDLSIHAG